MKMNCSKKCWGLASVVILIFVFFTAPASASDQPATNHRHGIEITYPSAAQTTIAPGRDFYVVGTINKFLDLPDDAHMEVTVAEKESGAAVRTVYTDIKNNKKGLYVDYPKLTLENCTKEEFRNSCMPDIVYDPKNPETFRDTWIKAYYNDKIFTCLIYGGNTASRDVNAYDQNGNLLRPLLGDYTIAVTISKGETVLAHTSLDITIADYPEKVLARFSPDEHMGRVTYDAAIHDWMLLLDPFPGYWNMPMFFPEWKLPYQGSIGWKWRHNDALEYSGGRIHMYLYGTSISSTSYSVELAKLQLQADLENPARLIPRYYSIGEPTLPGINERGYFIDMEDDEYLVFTRVDREEFANKENEIDMDSLLTMQSETDLTRLIRADWGDTLAFCGVCRPIQTDTMEYDLESGAYSWSNGFDRIEYNVNADDEYTFSWTSPISLTRKYSNGTNTTSAFEFRTNFLIEELYEGRILDVTARLIDDEGNPLTDYMKCCSIYVDEQYPSKSKQ